MVWLTCVKCGLKIAWIQETSFKAWKLTGTCARGHDVGRQEGIYEPDKAVSKAFQPKADSDVRAKRHGAEVPVRESEYHAGVLERIGELRAGVAAGKAGSGEGAGRGAGKAAAGTSEGERLGKGVREKKGWTEVPLGAL